jgi:hypothetical protein
VVAPSSTTTADTEKARAQRAATTAHPPQARLARLPEASGESAISRIRVGATSWWVRPSVAMAGGERKRSACLGPVPSRCGPSAPVVCPKRVYSAATGLRTRRSRIA